MKQLHMLPIDCKDRPFVILLGLFVLLCLACDFLMVPILWALAGSGPPRIPTFPLWLTIVGCVLAQGNLLAAWLAWSDQPFWQRLTRHWIIAAVLYLVWAAGLAVAQRSQFAEVGIVVGLSVPLVSIAAQIPLWIARQTFGWRLVRGDPKDDIGPAPLSIRHLMWATVLVALALALARLAPIPADDERAIIWTVMMVAACAVSTIALLPAAPSSAAVPARSVFRQPVRRFLGGTFMGGGFGRPSSGTFFASTLSRRSWSF